MERPDENTLRGLRVYADLTRTGRTPTAYTTISELKKKGVWQYVAEDDSNRTDRRQKETMYYQRHFIKAWMDSGWVSRGQ